MWVQVWFVEVYMGLGAWVLLRNTIETQSCSRFKRLQSKPF